jgi:hypothetical protein
MVRNPVFFPSPLRFQQHFLRLCLAASMVTVLSNPGPTSPKSGGFRRHVTTSDDLTVVCSFVSPSARDHPEGAAVFPVPLFRRAAKPNDP